MIGQKLKTAPPTGGHVFLFLTYFELGRDFIGTKLLTKFHEDGTRNQMLTDGRTYDGQRPVTKAHLSNQQIVDGRTHVRTHIRTPDITRSHKLTMSLRDR
ncbi:hypothetical protein DPMN_042084 [Dreissena polymorpha]|uniref:Uncharacterized protein n=1 Tax=Dreissena polymorpha TaxID=45954 RepID=A0A9D4HWR0_DREPO|nr:hypothetical protein DPMN_042084 [Dreissena polymorpha]